MDIKIEENKKWATVEDFATLFQYLWYRNFPIDNYGSVGAKRADWTIHIGLVVRQIGDLMGFVTRFEHGSRTDGILRSTEGDEIAIEWEWGESEGEIFKLSHPRVWSKISNPDRTLKYAVLITYNDIVKKSREDFRREINDKWNNTTYPLLLILIDVKKSKTHSSHREFDTLHMYKIENGTSSELRSSRAVPWNVQTTRWSLCDNK